MTVNWLANARFQGGENPKTCAKTYIQTAFGYGEAFKAELG
jgi:hypothetical protein